MLQNTQSFTQFLFHFSYFHSHPWSGGLRKYSLVDRKRRTSVSLWFPQAFKLLKTHATQCDQAAICTCMSPHCDWQWMNWCYFGSLQSICTTIELQSSILFSTSLRTTGVYEGIALSMKLTIWKQHNVSITIFAVQAWKVCPFGRHALWKNGNLLDRRPSLCLASEVVDKASFDLKKHSRFQIHRLKQKWG